MKKLRPPFSVRSRPVAAVLVLAMASAIASCRTRDYNPAPGSAASTGAVPVRHTLAESEFLEDVVPFEALPPMKYEQDMANDNLAALASDPGAIRTPMVYWSRYLIPNGRTPVPLPGKTVLAALRALRETHWELRQGLKKPDGYNSMDRVDQAKKVFEPGGLESGCLKNTTEHWSDLQFHYFCALPQDVRACYRMTVQDALVKAQTQNIPMKVEENRSAALAACLDPKNDKDDFTKSAASMGWLFTKQLTDFHDSQKVKSAVGGPEVNLFEYLMFAQTFLFDYRQEQAILNAFYADLAPLAPGGDLTPAGGETLDLATNAQACDALRPRRGTEQSLGSGEHCRAEKTLRVVHSIGR
jgi:hypothetical protein